MSLILAEDQCVISWSPIPAVSARKTVLEGPVSGQVGDVAGVWVYFMLRSTILEWRVVFMRVFLDQVRAAESGARQFNNYCKIQEQVWNNQKHS